MEIRTFKAGFEAGFRNAYKVIERAFATAKGFAPMGEEPRPSSTNPDFLEGYNAGLDRAERLATDELYYLSESKIEAYSRDALRIATL